MLTLIGSRAIKHHFPDFRDVTNRDWDWHADEDIADTEFMVDTHNDMFIDDRLAAWPWGMVATPDELYTLKCSHLAYEINGPREWDKHAADVVWLERKGCRFLRPLYDVVQPIWRERYKPSPTKLAGASKAGFFADAVVRKFDHDSLHASVAYLDRPMYESVLKDGSEVDCSWEKFEALHLQQQLWLCREEVFVTALERILIPADYKGSPRAAYHWALRRTITSLFKGPWSLFVVLHLDELMDPKCDYLQRHRSNRDRLIPLGGTNV